MIVGSTVNIFVMTIINLYVCTVHNYLFRSTAWRILTFSIYDCKWHWNCSGWFHFCFLKISFSMKFKLKYILTLSHFNKNMYIAHATKIMSLQVCLGCGYRLRFVSIAPIVQILHILDWPKLFSLSQLCLYCIMWWPMNEMGISFWPIAFKICIAIHRVSLTKD